MVIFETQNIYSSVQDETICIRFGMLFGLQGSQYDDNCVPQFTYPGRQELFYTGYHSEDELYNTIRNGLLSNVSNLIMWERISNYSVTGCGFTITFANILSKLKDEFPNNVHIVPDGTDTCQYLENYVSQDPCEGITCNPICIGYDLYSQICAEGECITDQLIETNSLDCEYIEPEPPTEPNNIIFYGTLGVAALIGLKLLSKK